MAFFDRLWASTWHALSLEAVEPPEAAALLLRWIRCTREGDGRVPTLASLAVQAAPRLLPNVALVAVGDGMDAAAYRFVGPRLTRLYRKARAGARLKDIYDDAIFAEIGTAFRTVLETGEPLFSRRNFVFLGYDFGYHRLILPCRTAAGEPVLLIVIHPTRRTLTDEDQWATAAAEYERVVALNG